MEISADEGPITPAIARATYDPRGSEPANRRLAPLIQAAVEITTAAPELEDTAWTAKCIASAALPYREPKPEQLTHGAWIRQNGNYTLWVQGGPAGLPFGCYPRIFMIWLTGEAIRQKTRTISTGGSFADFCRRVAIDPSRGVRGSGRRFLEQVHRLLSSRVGFYTGSLDTDQVNGAIMQFADQYRLFFAPSSPAQSELFDSTIVLTECFFDEITRHCIPLDMRAVAALRQSPLELDIYQWLAYRMFKLRIATRPTWQHLRCQFGSNHARMVDFRRDFLKALRRVTTVYPTARIEQTERGLVLFPSPTPIPRKPE